MSTCCEVPMAVPWKVAASRCLQTVDVIPDDNRKYSQEEICEEIRISCYGRPG